MMAAIRSSDRVTTMLVTDRGLGTSNSSVAQGGLQFPHDNAESLDRYRADMLASAGDGTIHPQRVDHFLSLVRPTVEVLESWGLDLDRDESGTLIRHLAGGLSESRIVTAKGSIGAALLRVLRSKIVDSEVEIRTRCSVNNITRTANGIELATSDGTIPATAVIAAIGGTAFQRSKQLGLPTSNPANQNDRLYTALRRLGLEEIDPDEFQFQPYGIVSLQGEPTGHCVPESIIELGARVVGGDGSPIIHAGANRREVTEAMAARIDEAPLTADGSPAFLLTLGDVDDATLFTRYPQLRRRLLPHRLESGHVHIAPVLHYQLGGFGTRPDGSTSVPGLYLAGEVTGGLHGSNRLMGNGITEAVVDGLAAADAAVRFVSATEER